MITRNDLEAAVQSQNSRVFDTIASQIREDYDNRPGVHIYNIYNQAWTRALGGLGTFYIPACDDNGSTDPAKWEPYSKPVIVPAMVYEYYDAGDNQMRSNMIPGRDLARDILSTGSSSELGSNSLDKWGVFIAEGAKPTAKELGEAKKKLIKTLTNVLKKADTLARGTAKERDSINDDHRAACNYLRQQREWNSAPTQNVNCEFCGGLVKEGIAICPNCHSILDREKWLKGQPDYTPPIK